MLIKICGLTRDADAALAEQMGADYLGAIMAGGPRNLREAEARRVLGPRRRTIQRAVVFGEQSLEQMASIAERLSLDVMQVHRDIGASDVAWLRARVDCAVWPVLRIAGTSIPPAAFELADAAGFLLFDARVVGQLGGTGVTLDWKGLQAEVAELRDEVTALEIILAGGLNSKNVAVAAQLLQPDVVDVSSGVESAPGIKDAAAMAALINAARTGEPRHS
jgi:phosphoribosylanthranilate isomerase